MNTLSTRWPDTLGGKTAQGSCQPDYSVFEGPFPQGGLSPKRDCILSVDSSSASWGAEIGTCEPTCVLFGCQNGGTCFQGRCVCDTSQFEGRYCEISTIPDVIKHLDLATFFLIVKHLDIDIIYAISAFILIILLGIFAREKRHGSEYGKLNKQIQDMRNQSISPETVHPTYWTLKPNYPAEKWKTIKGEALSYQQLLLRSDGRNRVSDDHYLIKMLTVLVKDRFGVPLEKVTKAYALYNKYLESSFENRWRTLHTEHQKSPNLFKKSEWIENGPDVLQKFKFLHHYTEMVHSFNRNNVAVSEDCSPFPAITNHNHFANSRLWCQ